MKAKAYNMGRCKSIQCIIKPLLLTLDSDTLNWCNFKITAKCRENVWNLQNSRGEKWNKNNLPKDSERKDRKKGPEHIWTKRKVYVMEYRVKPYLGLLINQ